MTHDIYLNEKEATRITDGDKMFLVLPLEGHDGGFQRGDSVHFVVTKTGREFKRFHRSYTIAGTPRLDEEREELVDHPLNEEDRRYVITYVEPLIDTLRGDEDRYPNNQHCVIGFRKGM